MAPIFIPNTRSSATSESDGVARRSFSTIGLNTHPNDTRLTISLARPHTHTRTHTITRANCRYFYIPARKEHRGIGGIFYDDMSTDEAGFDVLSFTRDVGRGMLPSWMPYVDAQRGSKFTPEQREWQVRCYGSKGIESGNCLLAISSMELMVASHLSSELPSSPSLAAASERALPRVQPAL
jgi:hypothetical protein